MNVKTSDFDPRPAIKRAAGDLLNLSSRLDDMAALALDTDAFDDVTSRIMGALSAMRNGTNAALGEVESAIGKLDMIHAIIVCRRDEPKGARND